MVGMIFCDNVLESLLEYLSLGQKKKKEVQRKPLPAFAVFQVPTVQNNQYTKVAYFRVACSELLQLYFGVAYSATF